VDTGTLIVAAALAAISTTLLLSLWEQRAKPPPDPVLDTRAQRRRAIRAEMADWDREFARLSGKTWDYPDLGLTVEGGAYAELPTGEWVEVTTFGDKKRRWMDIGGRHDGMA
jgi:hypothetical protein